MEFILLLVLALAVFRLILVLWDRRLSARFKINSLVALAIYFAYCGVGIAAMIGLAMRPALDAPDDLRVLAAVVLLLAWIGLGGVWLARLAPRTQDPPRWILRPWGALDLTLLGIIAAALLTAVLGP